MAGQAAGAMAEEVKKGAGEANGSARASKMPQLVAAAVASLAAFSNGLTVGWTSVAQPMLQASPSPLGADAAPVSEDEMTWLTSALYLAAVLALLPWAWASDAVSRKGAGYAIGALYILTWLLLAAAPGVEALYAARAAAGVAVAGLFFFLPAYLREIAEDDTRGALGSFMAVFFNLGVLVVYGAGAFLGYQALILFCLAWACVFEVGFWLLPETPVCLLERGCSQAAEGSLRWLRGKDADVGAELCALEAAAKRRRALAPPSLLELLGDRASARGLLITSAMCLSQPLCGFFVVLSYSVSIFAEAGVPLPPAAAAALPAALLLASSIASAWLVDRAGRRPLFLVSEGTLVAALTALGAYSYAHAAGADVTAVSWLPVACLALFMAAIGLAVTTLPFVVITEIFLPAAQRLATTAGGGVILAFAFLATKFFSAAVAALGLHGCYWLFAALTAALTLFIFAAYPETKGKPLEDIRRELAGDKPDAPRDAADAA